MFGLSAWMEQNIILCLKKQREHLRFQYNTKSFKLQRYQSVHLGSTSDYESVSPALLQIKVPTGAMERQNQDNHKEGMVLHVAATDNSSLLILP